MSMSSNLDWLAPVLFRSAYTIALAIGLFAFARSLWQTFDRDVRYVKKLHQIPCHRCVFFTGDYRLKCPVHPYKALNEDAIDCRDFQSNES